MIAHELEISLHMAFVESRQRRHEFITVEHLLLAMLDNISAIEVLNGCSINIENLRALLLDHVARHTPTVSGIGEVDTQPTLGFQRVIQRAILHVQSTYNNTKALVTDLEGNAVMFSSSGALGFKGAKKGTPYAAAKVGEVLGEKAQMMGIKEVSVIVKGVGSGRESTIRGFVSFGIDITRIQDKTPVPHNGPRARKARRV